MNSNDILYTACFLDFNDMWDKISHITDGRYERVIRNPHITFLYKPHFTDYSLIGEKVKVLITGYGYNDENEGLSVKVITDNKKLNALYESIEVPHITLTVKKCGQAVNTRYVDFYPIPIIETAAVYGAVTENGKVITSIEK